MSEQLQEILIYCKTAAEIQVDENGDLEVPRRQQLLKLNVRLVTKLNKVGLQIWQGSFLLSDYFLSEQGKNLISGQTILELGCGTGVAGIIAARYASKVFLTDNDDEVLKNARNCSFENNQSENVIVKKLDWNKSLKQQIQSQNQNEFGWTLEDSQILEHVEVVFCGDMTYDVHLVKQFVRFLEELLEYTNCKFAVILAVEKRLNFVVEDMDVVDQGYDFLLSYFNNNVTFEVEKLQVCQKIEYDRSDFVELWKISTNFS